jgi:acyl-CoA synthetase (AMP-forming)/AMP-acid ligase II
VAVLDQTLREAARRFPERRALVHGDRSFTYADLDEQANRVAAGLAQLGVHPGDLVALVLPNEPEYVLAYLGLARLGAVATGVSPRYTDVERARLLDRAQPALVLDHLPASEREPPAPPDADLDRPETVVFTSGTTGAPKGALFTGRQIRAITDMDTGGAWGAGGPQLIATGLPHVGFMTKLAGNLQNGTTMHLLTRWRATDALEIIARERIAFVGGVAAQISLLLAVPDFDRYDLSAVQGLIVGAGPSPIALVREARARFGAGYSIRYSSTESGGLGTLTAFDASDEELQTVGRPRAGIEIEIRDGRVCIRSPAVMARYWRDDDATAAALDRDGWLRTDDVGLIGDDGCLRITGRVSDMYIRGGYNVFPLEVEGVLLGHPAVANVAVVPRADPVMGEIGVAVVVVRAGALAPTLDELRAFASSSLAAYKLPEALEFVDALPLTTMDKVDRRALAALVRR